MLQNFFDDIQQDDSYVTTEPVTLAEAKTQCIVTHNEDDDYFTNTLIPAARATVENYCHICLVEKTVTATLRIENNISTKFYASYQSPEYTENVIELPYGPIKDISSITRICGSSITALAEHADYELTGALYKNITLNSAGNYILVYTTGYRNSIPKDLKLAILNELAFRYEKRGDEGKRYSTDQPGLCAASQALADKYRRVAWH